MMDPWQVILFLLGFGSILFLSYVTTRYLTGKTNKAMKGKHLNIIETLSLGTDKRIHLVKAGERYVLIASSSKSIEFLTTIDINDKEQLGEAALNSNNTSNAFDFKALFEKYLNSYKSRKNDTARSDISIQRNEDDKFRMNLYKLKDITQKINTQVKKDGVDVTNEK